MHKRIIRIFQYPLSELTTRSIRCKDSGTCNDASVVKRKLKNIGIYSLDVCDILSNSYSPVEMFSPKPITITKANVNSHHRRYAKARAEDNADALLTKPITITKANVNSHHRRYANARAEDNADALLTSSSYSNHNNLNINVKDEAYITVTANGFSNKSD
uniref:Uncharacterized protein n=1 Tax=Glossina palpalis gambiensis TaxID=67801 RepID=A0A1B0B3N9_9MUSC